MTSTWWLPKNNAFGDSVYLDSLLVGQVNLSAIVQEASIPTPFETPIEPVPFRNEASQIHTRLNAYNSHVLQFHR